MGYRLIKLVQFCLRMFTEIISSESFSSWRESIFLTEGLETLTIAGSPLVKDRVEELCELAYPGSLTEELEKIRWVDIPNITGWTFERFEVLHDESVEPHGWFLEHETGLKLVHSGDSGPCETLWDQIKKSRFSVCRDGDTRIC